MTQRYLTITLQSDWKGALRAAAAALNLPVALTSCETGSLGLGDWLEAHVTITKMGRRLAYASCDLRIGERHIMHASGVFAMHERTPKADAPEAPPPARTTRHRSRCT